MFLISDIYDYGVVGWFVLGCLRDFIWKKIGGEWDDGDMDMWFYFYLNGFLFFLIFCLSLWNVLKIRNGNWFIICLILIFVLRFFVVFENVMNFLCFRCCLEV